ncbi:MotA/TolQ/ExbB proton channel family protein [Porphyromonas sp. oral taxon 275]|uniref:MotA/TolQ/ExbB proton channel family protein n=1 Tax=Porphyromonas sp. oral taxon 275 TaxID=712435 RepID=UPI001BA61BCA|nr:MotA/TolQ/ExbB proton channel family protein [Porphyromonas sp. oral taxon 275]QUB42507.1 MotA/TolQ/ExbB proton channel family protein [Porphyromonas sp. oral taxon 275]
MKKLFATVACVALLSAGFSTIAMAQNADSAAAAPATEQVDSTAAAAPQAAAADASAAAGEEVAAETTFHQELKTKFIEGGADFMALVAITLILGLAICLERIIYLNLANTNPDQLLKNIEAALAAGDLERAKSIARDTRGPIASIAYQALLRANQGIDIVEKSVVSYGGVQGGLLEKNLSWITLFIAMAPSLGFLGTVVGMVQAFDNIERVGDISPTVVAGGMKVALITTIGGLVVALILQIFYNYILSLVEGILNRMEDASITLLDLIVKYNEKR